MGLFDWFRGKRAPLQSVQAAVDPQALAQLEKTRRPFIRIDYDVTSSGALPPTVSKIGGVPYVPEGATAPTSQLVFIAQLNLAELPRVDALTLPDRGILQFWVDDDDTFGLYDDDGSERTDGHRVIYYESLDATQTDGIAGYYGRGPLVLDDPHGRRLRFSLDTEVAPQDAYAASGDKVGGYCAFTQDDPRDPADPMLSLLQLDDSVICGWGDAGIAHWFIREADLRARNFANVRYYWDCC